MTSFAKYAWFVLVYNLGVVAWGAYVRATGSGAGCGAHWPLCNGEVIPQTPDATMLVEFSHRVSSGLTLLFAIVLLVWAWRTYPRGNIIRSGAGSVMLFTITEALVGAGLVLFKLVGQNESITRAVAMALHLLNTFLLLGALVLTAYWASGGLKYLRLQRRASAFLLFALLGVLLVGVSGAITALGDTLFPSASLAQGIQQDFSTAANFLVNLRVYHPLLAIGVGIYLVTLGRSLSDTFADSTIRRLVNVLALLVVVQWIAGIVNVFLLAPVWLQLVHLFLADLLWLVLVLLAAVVHGLANLPERDTASSTDLGHTVPQLNDADSKA